MITLSQGVLVPLAVVLLSAVTPLVAGVQQILGGPLVHTHTHSFIASGYKYLVASFPKMKQVAYLHLPDTVWRPLVVGPLGEPMAVAVDPLNSRLFVADKQAEKIYWYNLYTRQNGLLQTDGHQHVAVEGVTAFWMNVNGVGDLYFSGKKVEHSPDYGSVFRQDAKNIAMGDSLNPVEVYSRSNSGAEPTGPKVWMPSGIAVDSFHIFWGNQEKGSTSGSIVKGSRKNIGAQSDQVLTRLNAAHQEVRGVAVTGNNVYYLAKDVTTAGIYGMPKVNKGDQPEKLESAGQIAPLDPLTSNAMDLAWDGDHTIYFTDYSGNKAALYSIPDGLVPANVTQVVQAPGIYSIAVLTYTAEPPAYAQVAYVGSDFSGSQRHIPSFVQILVLVGLPLCLLRY
eukprot:gnl/TRDRNA2_/TRDRNA2_184072_c0_seq1.p1 gnl/TRDRNA2_/TRDRNA2_184072_c0~~gnl/TRDRNA2_/TRDRNA2_184072_c0_seq1.p1  ORF type:complete len:395 (+),score=59.04 gnl/TRDRNA2_/TRDRNA2_184072_c0_seq1:85-1269(+)